MKGNKTKTLPPANPQSDLGERCVQSAVEIVKTK